MHAVAEEKERVLRFTTDDIPARDRFEHWREARAKNLFGVTIELAREKRGDFRGHFTAESYGGAIVSEMQASAYRVSRTEQDIARLSSDSLLLGWQVEGGGWMETGRRSALHRVESGAFTVGHSEQTYSGTPSTDRRFLWRMIKIPLVGCDFAPPLADLVSQPIETAYLRPLTALFSAIGARDPTIPDPAAGIEAIGRLALVATGKLSHHEPENRAALRLALLQAARAILRRDLGRPDLSPFLVARELGVSPRQLHILFEPSGLSFARTLTGFRLERVLNLLLYRPERTVADIAYACGFDSLATFYRAFRAAHGMTPLDMRSLRPVAI